MLSIIHSLFTVCSLSAWTEQFMRKQRIKFSLNDNPLLASPEKTNGAPRWCFNITNCLGVPGKVTDVALRMKKGWGAGQGQHTPRLGSDKHCWLEFCICPKATKGRSGQRGESSVPTTIPLSIAGVGESWGLVQYLHTFGFYRCSIFIVCCLNTWA